ncbi:endonuclease MutS2 [Phaeocystidibacter luteus]|uniref:DNA mismatch repair proteins mutS family domain-containing protein n=1 Tax=Phaeocystidibacter luteus TaxID=911197 RepID=A0A6N6RIN9_9FLAO|nr:hypothetical protein [Phaeocystidibacter luteus]KAB2810166.1 hypothetical protein F8C67_08000 [Phaeocystidibacter luteus]
MIIYPSDIIEHLEFTDVRSAVSKYAVTNVGRDKLEHLLPSSDQREIEEALTEVNEILSIYQSERSVPALAAADLTSALSMLRIKNAVLEPEQFLDVKLLVESYNRLQKFCETHLEYLPTVALRFRNFPPNLEIPAAIDKVLERNGVVKSNASSDLSKIRTQLSRKRTSADRLFYKAVRKYESLGLLGDVREGVHDDRRTMGIQAGFKGRVNGLLHGASNKHSLVFIEPGECVEINNEVAMLVDDEKREIRRILRELTQLLALHQDELKAFSRIMAEIDFIHAKARYALAEDACLPSINNEGVWEITKGINPVLRHFHKTKNRSVVPLDINLDPDQRIVVISGPNAGGKSITLKTVGLFQLMLQSGLLLPVHPSSSFPIINKILADIGDSQSIENELSTYSSKLEKMKEFLKTSDTETLFLIDEFGSGSDPDLGAVLAQVFLKSLNRKKAYGIATTHYNSIKSLAASLPGVVNGSMLFNGNTLEPEYLLQVGQPGSSYTFEVAERAGIPKGLITSARKRLKEGTRALDELLVELQKERHALGQEREETSRRLEELENMKARQGAQIKKLEDKIQKQSQTNADQNEQLMWGKRFEGLVKSWNKATNRQMRKAVMDRFQQMLSDRSGEVQKVEKKRLSKAQKQKKARLKRLTSEEVKVGDKVKLINARQSGQIVEIKKDKYVIAYDNGITTTTERDKFILANRKM